MRSSAVQVVSSILASHASSSSQRRALSSSCPRWTAGQRPWPTTRPESHRADGFFGESPSAGDVLQSLRNARFRVGRMADALMVSSSFLPGRGGSRATSPSCATTSAPRWPCSLPASVRGQEPARRSRLRRPSLTRDGCLFPGRKARTPIVAAAAAEEPSRSCSGRRGRWFDGPPSRAPRLAVLGDRARSRDARPVGHPRQSAGALARALAGAELFCPVSEYTANSLRTFLEEATDAGAADRDPPRSCRSRSVPARRRHESRQAGLGLAPGATGSSCASVAS